MMKREDSVVFVVVVYSVTASHILLDKALKCVKKSVDIGKDTENYSRISITFSLVVAKIFSLSMLEYFNYRNNLLVLLL